MAAAAGSAPATPEKGTSSGSSPSSSFPSLRLASLDELLIKTVLNAGPTTTGPFVTLNALPTWADLLQHTVAGGKEPLSLQATSVNFRRFVQKSGPIFVAQDAAEAVLRWEDPTKTVFFAGAWAFLCASCPVLNAVRQDLISHCVRSGWCPQLVLFVPSLVLVAVLLTTYSARRGNGPPPDSPDGPTSLSSAPPTEGSIDYLANLQNIQIMMGRLADLSDLGRSLVPYLTWHDERLTRALLHLSVVSSFVLALFARFIPWRLVFFLIGESVFVVGHPVVQAFIASLASSARLNALRKAKQQQLKRLLEDDALTEPELDMEIVEVVRVEMESRTPDGGWESEVVVGGELPDGFKWLGDWEDCVPDDGAVDAEGWTYLHIDGTRTASPFVQGEKSPITAGTRRRRLMRRALRIPWL
ncbi:SPOSA6832_03402, partial [Sporobolomyces salmonicolor]